MKAKKWFSFTLALMMLVSLSVGIAGGTAYAADGDYHSEDFEGTQFVVNSTPPEGQSATTLVLSATPSSDKSEFKIKSDSDPNFGKYLEYGREAWSGEPASNKLIAYRRGVTGIPDFHDGDHVYAFEFDCKGVGENKTYRFINLSKVAVEIGGVYLNNNGNICAWEWDGTNKKSIDSGVKFDMNQWNHFKLLFYTEKLEYEIYYNNSPIPVARASYANNRYVTDDEALVPQGFYTSMQLSAKTTEDNAYPDTLSIDNVRIYEETTAVYYGSPKIFTNYDTDAEVDITETGLVAGDVTAEIDITNLSNDNIPVTLIAALYKDNSLADISIVSGTYGTTPKWPTAKIFTEALTVPNTDTDKYRLKVFVWDSKTTLKPLAGSAEFTTPNQ